jgi:hypothetical protein
MKIGTKTYAALAVLLMTLGLPFAAVENAEARTQTEILLAQYACNLECDDSQVACNSGCCILNGRLCGGRCITSCQGTADTCKSDCALSSLGGALTTSAFFDTVTIAPSGRLIRVGGPFLCPQAATVDLNVTLTQNGVGAVASGATHFTCPRGETTFGFDVSVDGNTTFLPLGTAQACGTARVRAGKGLSLDSFQWCRDVTVVPEGVELQDE